MCNIEMATGAAAGCQRQQKRAVQSGIIHLISGAQQDRELEWGGGGWQRGCQYFFKYKGFMQKLNCFVVCFNLRGQKQAETARY